MSIIDYVLKITSKFDSKGFKNLTSNLTETQRNILKISTMTAPIFASMTNMAVNFGKQLLESSKNLGAYESRFYAITGDQKSAHEELQWTFDLARRTATNINTLTDAYSIFYATARKSLGQENTRLIMEDWAEIARVTHLSGDAFGRVMYAMRELSSKGAIYADDIKRQLGSAVPNAIEHARKAAEDLGITGTDWWEKLQKEAKNNQPLVNKFMIQFTKHAHEALASPEALRESLSKTDSTLQALSNTWEIFKMRLVQTEAFKKLIRMLQNFVIWLDKISQNTELIKQIVIAFVTIWITLLTFQVAGFFAMLIANLSTVNVMLAGIPILIGLIVMGIMQIVMHWKQINKKIEETPEWLKIVLSALNPIFSLIFSINKLMEFWKENGEEISTEFELFFTFLKEDVDALIKKTKDFFKDLSEKLKELYNNKVFRALLALLTAGTSELTIKVAEIAEDKIKEINKKTNESKLPKVDTKPKLLHEVVDKKQLDIIIKTDMATSALSSPVGLGPAMVPLKELLWKEVKRVVSRYE